MIVFGNGTFGRRSGHEGRTTMTVIHALIKETQRNVSLLPTCGDIVKRWPTVNQEIGSHKISNLLAP